MPIKFLFKRTKRTKRLLQKNIYYHELTNSPYLCILKNHQDLRKILRSSSKRQSRSEYFKEYSTRDNDSQKSSKTWREKKKRRRNRSSNAQNAKKRNEDESIPRDIWHEANDVKCRDAERCKRKFSSGNLAPFLAADLYEILAAREVNGAGKTL